LDVCPSAYSLLKFFNRLLITLQLLRCFLLTFPRPAIQVVQTKRPMSLIISNIGFAR